MLFLHILLFLSFMTFVYAGIEDTKHNIATVNGRLLNPDVEGSQLALCIWCHTLNINTSFVEVEFKWDPQKPVENFTVYGQSKKKKVLKEMLPASLACLTCHDGANAPNITFGRASAGTSVHSHPVFVVFRPGTYYLKPFNTPLVGWGKKNFVGDLVKDYNGRIQCGSCHDPHTTNPIFLRYPNRGSMFCMGCHDL
ncbi:cytochrome c3 family protein [Persephonella sp.]